MNASERSPRDTFAAPLPLRRLVILCALVAFGTLAWRSAWICDDSFITMRTVDHFVNGRGLVWNTGERVQAYTHPLWMLCLSAGYAVTREPYWTPLVLCWLASMLAVWLVLRYAARGPAGVLAAAAVFVYSRAFLEYSSSGLENALSHVLVAAFLILYFRGEPGPRTAFGLSLCATLAALNRPDTPTLLFPPLCAALIVRPCRRSFGAALLGGTPLFLWVAFSTFYYGFPVPNTAYAKLNTGIPAVELARQGFSYLLNSLGRDPLTLGVVGAALALSVAAALRGRFAGLPVAIGLALQLGYVVKVGGDFMTGRLLTVSLMAAVVVLARAVPRRGVVQWMPLAMVLAVGLAPDKITTLGDSYYLGEVDNKGITNEAWFYGRQTSLLSYQRQSGQAGYQPVHNWAIEGWQLRLGAEKVVIGGAIGFPGFNAGPEIYMVDKYALADPLLARLPAYFDVRWRVGHYERLIPEGYLETLRTGRDQFKDKDLGEYWKRLQLVTRGPLFSAERLREIGRFLSGENDRLIDYARYRYPGLRAVSIAELAIPKPERYPWDGAGTQKMERSGLEVLLGRVRTEPRLEFTGDNNDEFELRYMQDGAELARHRVPPRPCHLGGLSLHRVTVPPAAAQAGYDKIWFVPVASDNFVSIGDVRLLP